MRANAFICTKFAQVAKSLNFTYIQLTCDNLVSTKRWKPCIDLHTNLSSTEVNASGWRKSKNWIVDLRVRLARAWHSKHVHEKITITKNKKNNLVATYFSGFHLRSSGYRLTENVFWSVEKYERAVEISSLCKACFVSVASNSVQMSKNQCLEFICIGFDATILKARLHWRFLLRF